MNGERQKRGRPKVWNDTRSRQRAHQERQRQKLRLVDDLLHAVRNAQWDEPELHRQIQEGDDAEVLQALIRHYRAHYWLSVQANRATTKGGDSE